MEIIFYAMTFDGSVIYIEFYSLEQTVMKDGAHEILRSSFNVLQAKEHQGVALHRLHCSNKVYFSSLGCMLIWLLPREAIHERYLLKLACIIDHNIVIE